MSENLLTVAALRTNVEADMIRNKLEAAGIAAVLVEPEKAADGAPAARVQVQVNPPDFERAMQLLFPIPKLKPAAKVQQPPWKCPKCGEQVQAQFPKCWSCGTAREASPAAAAVQPAMPAATAAPQIAMPPMPAPPPAAPSERAAPAETIPRLSVPGPSLPPMEQPQSVGTVPSTIPPNRNGDALKAAPLPKLRAARTAEDEALKIIVPPWDAAAAKSTGGQSSTKKGATTDADDRAARRAWWTAVFGIIVPPLLIYSIGVVLILGLTNRPLSRRGDRFFYGALAINALIIGALFVVLGMQQ